MVQKFKPVNLVRPDGRKRVARTAEEEVKLRYEGYKPVAAKKASAPKPTPPKSDD